jgi:hypothetical protein
MGIFGSLQANLHIPCRAHAVPRPCRVAKDLDCVVPIHLHNATVSDSHKLCRAHAVPLWKRILTVTAQQGRGTEGVRHGMCELVLTNVSIRTLCCNSSVKFHQVSKVECLFIMFHILK